MSGGDAYGQKARWRVAMREWIDSLKGGSCIDCGGTFPPECMDFDHAPEADKEFNIGRAGADGYGKERIREEITKCELVCSNCHRIRTKQRQDTKKPPLPKKGGRPRSEWETM